MSCAALDAKYTPEVLKRVSALLEKAFQTGERTAALEKVQAVLEQAGLVWQERVPPELVGAHPANRSGLMLDVATAHQHGAEILATSFSFAKARDATAVEADAATGLGQSQNERLVQSSKGMLAPLKALKLLSVGGSHTNAFLRAVKGNCLTPVETLAD